MAHTLMSFPTVLWEVENAYSVGKQTSSTFTFLGEHWTLYFHHSCTIRGQFIQIFLKRTESYKKINYLLCVKTSVVKNNAPYNYETRITIDTSSAKEWCVWDEDMTKIRRCVEDTAILFFCSIQPQSGWEEILHENADKGIKLSGGSADTESLREDFGNLFDKHVGADVIFNCKGEMICAHRAVLSSRSRVFAAMFQADMKEPRDGFIDITDTEPFILRLLLRYLYTGDLPHLSLNTAVKVYFLADKYGIDVLKRNCVFFMMDNLEVDTSKGASELTSEENLTMKIRSRLRNIRQVLCTDNWKFLNKEQLKMSMDAFHTLVGDVYSELCTGEENGIPLLNQDVKRKKIKLMISECNKK